MIVTRLPPGAARRTGGCEIQTATIGKDGLCRYLVVPSKRVVVKGKHEGRQDGAGFSVVFRSSDNNGDSETI